MKKLKLFSFCLLFIFSLTGCIKYSLSGAAIQPDWNTIYVATFPNYAPQQNPTLSQDLTISVQDIFRNRTKLNLNTNENSDLIIEGEITGYDITAEAIQSNSIAAKNRLTISVKIRYINNKDESKNYEKTFSAFQLYDGNAMLSSVESTIVPLIIEDIRDQIFASIAMDW
ncbi:LptE family protein [Chishuiella sp.]|uniref:LptE family protein n=1 Tax=Chishuiella sp. TaxID=1969467 RepID=UPI0028A5ADCA|nr:LptE family protein [Chishuiella sp.]